MASASSHRVELISECFVKPQTLPEEWDQPVELMPWDIRFLSTNYIQKGLLFAKPSPMKTTNKEANQRFMEGLVERLRHSLSVALVQFYPLAGRLKTRSLKGPPPSCSFYVDCRGSAGARFIFAALDMTASDVTLERARVPEIVRSFFDHRDAIGLDGHSLSLLFVQVTELSDSVVVGCSMNHSIADGTSFWNFFKSWSAIFRASGGDESILIPRPPVFKRWFLPGFGPIFSLPFKHAGEFVSRPDGPEPSRRVFHLSAESVAKLKGEANAVDRTIIISSLQSLSALVWRCVTRAWNLPPDQTTSCILAANNRMRLDPPEPDYFGYFVGRVVASCTASKLLGRDLTWAAAEIHRAVAEYSGDMVRESLERWFRAPPSDFQRRRLTSTSVVFGGSPRFNMYGCEFGMSKAVAVLSTGITYDGKVSSMPGRCGAGSVAMEICLLPDAMSALESDEEFMGWFTP